MVGGKIGVGKGLSLYSLGGVHHKHRSFAGGKGTGNLIVKVNVAGSVDEIKLIGLSVVGLVIKGDGVGLYGNASFPFEVHTVEQLILHIAQGHRVGYFEHTVGQGGFTVVDVGDYTKISDVLLWNFQSLFFLFRMVGFWLVFGRSALPSAERSADG